MNPRLTPYGLDIMLQSPEGTIFNLSSGHFTGGVGHLLCQGKLTQVFPSHPSSTDILDGGTWTGTPGGPMSMPAT